MPEQPEWKLSRAQLVACITASRDALEELYLKLDRTSGLEDAGSVTSHVARVGVGDALQSLRGALEMIKLMGGR